MQKEESSKVKNILHPRNKNRERYDLINLIDIEPELKLHITTNPSGFESINFKNPDAVRLLNKALLAYHYEIKNWDFPKENLCPPIPGRADYLHHIADLLALSNKGKIPFGDKVVGLDIGTGATCIYPILGTSEYSWDFVASDINSESLQNSDLIIKNNQQLQNKITTRLQPDPSKIFTNIISENEHFDFTLCNPPFHSSQEEAEKGTLRKIKNLSENKSKKLKLNFAGVSNELIYDGGEFAFIDNMINDSLNFKQSVFWFTTLVSKESNLIKIYKTLDKMPISQRKTIDVSTGNKKSRIVCWTFLTEKQQAYWVKKRWF